MVTAPLYATSLATAVQTTQRGERHWTRTIRLVLLTLTAIGTLLVRRFSFGSKTLKANFVWAWASERMMLPPISLRTANFK